MSDQELQDPVLVAVRRARPAIDEAVLRPTSADAVRVLERARHGEDRRMPAGSEAPRDQRRAGRRRLPAIRQIFRPRIGAIAIGAAVAVAIVVLALSGVSGAPSLVDRAYAAINPGDQVLHEVDVERDPTTPGYTYRTEGWLFPADGRARVIQIWGYKRFPFVSEWIITATGRVYGRVCLNDCHPASFINGSGWTSDGNVTPGTLGGPPENLPGTFAGWFQTAYRARAIVADGTTTFGGRRVARLQSMAPTFGSTIVFWRPGTPPPLSARKQRSGPDPYSVIDWYVDPGTAQPVGFTVSPCTGVEIRSCTRPISTTRIVTFQQLEPTPQNLAELTRPSAPPGAR